MRIGVCVALGVVVGLVLTLAGELRHGAVSGLMTVAGAYVALTYLAVRPFKGLGTQQHAVQEDTSWVVRDIGIAAVIPGNLSAVVAMLALDRGGRHDLDAGLAVGSVLLSWFLLQTLYVSHYARLFCSPPEPGVPALDLVEPGTGQTMTVAGGIDVNAPGYWPAYADFTYFAFDLGMTFQVSDTSVSSPSIRRRVLGHCLLSYFFATAITAAVITSSPDLPRATSPTPESGRSGAGIGSKTWSE